ncbi:MAG: trigger factor [Erysipelotrichales bacterium]|nr:trigger factor [Erysipelotrichales bacterium]
MQREIKKLENCRTEVKVTFEPEEWKAARDAALNKLAKNVEIKGFRKGHAPIQLAKERISEGDIMNNALDSLLQNAYTKVLSEENIVPVARPSVNVTKLSDTECEVVILIPTRPEIKLGQYKGLEVGHNEVSVGNEELDAEIAKRLKDNAELVLKEDEAKLGDTVVIDFEGFIDGKAFDGGKAENFSLELGSNQFVPGFEDQLVGAKAEEKRDVVVTFPSNYPNGLNDKEATFKVVVHEVKEKVFPELSDEFVLDLDIKDVKNVDEYKAFVKKDLEERANRAENQRYFEALMDTIVKNAEAVVPQEFVDDEAEVMFNNLKQQVEQNGLDMDAYFKITNSKEEDVRAKMKEDARKNIIRFFLMEEIAKAEEIEVNDATIEFEIAKMAEQYGMEPEKIKEIVFKNKERFVSDIKQNQIVTFLLQNNK